MVTVGILALQGDVQEHVDYLQRLGASCAQVRVPADLEGIAALIIPGGESTTLTKLIRWAGLTEPVADLIRGGLPVWGTCAGTILLGRGGIWENLDAEVDRNAYGAQLDSTVSMGSMQDREIPMIFIRAPRLGAMAPDIEVLCRWGDDIVAARKGNILVSTFHPELTEDETFGRYFLGMICPDVVQSGR